MITCPRCGGQAPDGTPYCPYCGYGKQPPLPTQYIPTNQSLVNPQQVVSNFNQKNSQNNKTQEPNKKHNKKRSCLGSFIKVIGFALIIIIIFLVLLSMSGRPSKSRLSSATATFSQDELMENAIMDLLTPTKTPEPTITIASTNKFFSFVQETDISTTNGNSKALKQANRYLKVMAFSRNGLIDQLKYEGYSQSESEYAADNCGADWYEQASLKAKSYLSTMSFSIDSLIEQLEYEGFTHDEAVYGANSTEMNELDQAIAKANSYLSFSNFSKSGLIDQLVYEGFSSETASDAVNQIVVDWNEQARGKAKSYLEFMNFTYYDLISQLEYEGFTHAQAVYGADIIK